MSIPENMTIGEARLSVADVVRVARTAVVVSVTHAALGRMRMARSLIDKLVALDTPIYGVNTGFGDQVTSRIREDVLRTVQARILRSHAAGSGIPLPDEVVRAVMLLRANMLAQGYSGVRPVVVETLLALLNARIHPVVPEQGSVGASGDLAPLAHLSLPLIGEGLVMTPEGARPAATALRAAGIDPISLEAKEASSLTNGTEVTLALAALSVHDGTLVVEAAEIAAAMSLVALRGHTSAFDDRIHRVRPHSGQKTTAHTMRMLLQVEDRPASWSPRRAVHDVYTLRCIPQVIGPVREALERVQEVVEIELHSVTDNPLCFVDSEAILSGGNFHGHPLALASDYLKIALASLGTFAERRIASLLSHTSSGLPDLLTPRPGENSGLMLAQYAAASIASENKTLAHPASVDSITTAGGAEDFNSMSATAARHLRQVVSNTRRIVALEILAASQALDLAGEPRPRPVAAALEVVRAHVPAIDDDDFILSELASKVEALVASGELHAAVQRASEHAS